jgi:hypothetical protein
VITVLFLDVKIDTTHIQLLIGVQDEDSFGKSVLGETPQERGDEEAHQPPAESEVLHGNQKRQSMCFTKYRVIQHPLVVFT